MRHVCVHYRCVVSSNVCLTVSIMAGRNGYAIDDALESVAQAMHGQHNQTGDEFRGNENFQRNNSPMLKGMYDPEGAHAWLKEIEKIFLLMACTKE